MQLWIVEHFHLHKKEINNSDEKNHNIHFLWSCFHSDIFSIKTHQPGKKVTAAMCSQAWIVADMSVFFNYGIITILQFRAAGMYFILVRTDISKVDPLFSSNHLASQIPMQFIVMCVKKIQITKIEKLIFTIQFFLKTMIKLF